MASLYVEASEPARRFFEKRGFVVDARNDFIINAVAIHNSEQQRLEAEIAPRRSPPAKCQRIPDLLALS